jgi:glycosyltransferase involved in cell wall biosynthesis
MKFGICIATYKRQDGKTLFYLNRTLDSIKNQTYENYKIFLIGDKYEDDLEFESFGKNFDKTKIYKENLPFAAERDKYFNNSGLLWSVGGRNASNRAIDLAIEDGIDYIIKMDHDDWIEPNHLENFVECINKTNADFMCSKSTHINGVLPNINSNERFVPFLPDSSVLIKSSSCTNYKTIPIRSRNVFEETGKVFPGDADLWKRVKSHIEENNLKSFMINEITCHHDEEGYVKRGGR